MNINRIVNFSSAGWVDTDIRRYAVSGKIERRWKQSIPNKMSEFLRFTVAIDEILLMFSGEILQCKVYDAGGVGVARGSRGLISRLAKRETLPKEIVDFRFPYHLTERLSIVLPSNVSSVFFDPGDSLIFNILSTSTIPVNPHRDTLFSYKIYVFDPNRSGYTKSERKTLARAVAGHMRRQERERSLQVTSRKELLERLGSRK